MWLSLRKVRSRKSFGIFSAVKASTLRLKTWWMLVLTSSLFCSQSLTLVATWPWSKSLPSISRVWCRRTCIFLTCGIWCLCGSAQNQTNSRRMVPTEMQINILPLWKMAARKKSSRLLKLSQPMSHQCSRYNSLTGPTTSLLPGCRSKLSKIFRSCTAHRQLRKRLKRAPLKASQTLQPLRSLTKILKAKLPKVSSPIRRSYICRTRNSKKS